MPVTIKTVHRKVWAQIERYAVSWIGWYITEDLTLCFLSVCILSELNL